MRRGKKYIHFCISVAIISRVKTRNEKAILKIFRAHGGTLRTQQAIQLGVHQDAIYQLRDRGELTALGRGLYRLSEAPEFARPDLALVGLRAPDAVVCLISALSFHNITTQVPASIHLAVRRGGYYRIKLDPTPVTVYTFNADSFDVGLETHLIENHRVKIYSAARSIVDAFKFRNKLGLDVALEALDYGRRRLKLKNIHIEPIAQRLRVANVMAPYLRSG